MPPNLPLTLCVQGECSTVWELERLFTAFKSHVDPSSLYGRAQKRPDRQPEQADQD